MSAFDNAKRTGANKEVDLLPIKGEILADPDLNFLRLKVDSESQANIMSKKDDSPKLRKSINGTKKEVCVRFRRLKVSQQPP